MLLGVGRTPGEARIVARSSGCLDRVREFEMASARRHGELLVVCIYLRSFSRARDWWPELFFRVVLRSIYHNNELKRYFVTTGW